MLSHDFQENETYREACLIGREFKEIGSRLVNLKKKNETAILVSNEALTALKWFGIEAVSGDNGKTMYNDVVRWVYDTLYKMNVECDFIWPESEELGEYKMIIVPALYAAPDELLHRLNQYVREGGILIATFKTGFANENIKVSSEIQPHILRDCMGIAYDQFTFPRNVVLRGEIASTEEPDEVKVFMELIRPAGAQVLASYDHHSWHPYAAVTRNRYGRGTAYYIGCMTGEETLKKILKKALEEAKVDYPRQTSFPMILRKGVNDFGKTVWFCLNYSAQEQIVSQLLEKGWDLLDGSETGSVVSVPAWGLRLIETENS